MKLLSQISDNKDIVNKEYVDTEIRQEINEKQNKITSSSKLLSDLVDDTNQENKFVTTSEKSTWNNKGSYNKPVGGIPKTDLSTDVQSSLGKADTALQEHQDISGKVDKVVGKALSTNDFTDVYKNKVDEIFETGLVRETTSNSLVSFSDGANNVPVESLVVDINPVQDLHGYDNPYPAGGGKNKYNAETKTVGQALNTTNGGLYNNANWEVSDFIPVSDGEITLAWDSQTNYYQANICAYDASKNYIADSGTAYSGYAYSHTFTVPSGAAFVRFSWAFVVSGTEYPRTNVRVSIGATDLGYSPYSNKCPISGWAGANVYHSGADTSDATTYSITFPSSAGTVYGGTLDVTNGKLTVDRAIITVNGSEENTWHFSNGPTLQGVYTNSSLLPDVNTTSGYQAKALFNEFKTIYTSAQRAIGCGYVESGWLNIIFNPGTFSTSNDVKTWLASNPLQIVYEIATPAEYTLTPIEITLLFGKNNIWANTGNTTVTYTADTKLYIDNKFTQLQNAIISLGGDV